MNTLVDRYEALIDAYPSLDETALVAEALALPAVSPISPMRQRMAEGMTAAEAGGYGWDDSGQPFSAIRVAALKLPQPLRSRFLDAVVATA